MALQSYDPYASRDIADSSRRLYMYNLGQLAGGPFKNLNFLSDVPGITAKLEPMKPTTRRSYLIAIVSALKSDPSTKCSKLYTRYYPALEALNKELRNNTEKSESVKANWASLDELKAKQAEMMTSMPTKGARKLTSIQYQNLLDLFLVSLYTLQMPRRNLDFAAMVVGPPGEDKSVNYLWKGQQFFNRYKTAKTYACQVVDVNEALAPVMTAYLKFRPNKEPGSALLQTYDGTPITTSPAITKALNKIFGKKIGSTMIRRSTLTGKYAETMKAMKADAAAMGTSTDVAENTYIKVD